MMARYWNSYHLPVIRRSFNHRGRRPILLQVPLRGRSPIEAGQSRQTLAI
jgi:hypothetical protein